jgi:hypothetical protein
MPHLMNKQLLTILIVLFGTSILFGQVQRDVNKVLASKDFVAFKKYADNLSSRENRISSYWECLRDLTTDFQEGVFIFEKSVPNKNNPAISSVYSFSVNLITTKTTIVYYKLSEKKNKKVGTDWKSYYELIDNFKDDKAFEKVKSTFKSTFQSDLNENELFVTDFVYGSHCGFAGVNPKGRQQIDNWVAEKNKAELLKWLKSANTEKQVYAVDGLLQLKKSGIKLTDKEKKIIKFICSKNGTLYVCSGCMYNPQDIGSVTKRFKL